MDPNIRLNRMLERIAFDNAIKAGLSVATLVNEQAATIEATITERIDQYVADFEQFVAIQEQACNKRIEEAKDLAPEAALAYCNQLTQRLEELKQALDREKNLFNFAEQTVHNKQGQIAILQDSVDKMKSALKHQSLMNSQIQEELGKFGTGLSRRLAGCKQIQNK